MSEPVDDRPELLRLLFPHKAPGSKKRTPPAPTRTFTSGEISRYASTALDHEVDAVLRAGEGTRNDTLNIAGFCLSQLVAGGYLPHDLTWDTLRDAGLSAGLTPAETESTLRSAFRAGQERPRVIPNRDPIPTATVLPFMRPVAVDVGGGDPSGADPDADTGAEIEALFPRINWAELWADETVDEWLLWPLIPARRLVALFSPPKVGKSLLMLEIAVAIAKGNCSVLGQKLGAGRKVLYVDFENDPRGDVRTRLQAMGVGPDDLDNLVYLSFPSLAYLDTVMGGLQLEAIAKHYGVELVIIDTISRAVQGEENANDTWLAFYRNTGVRLKEAGIACVRLDHTGKDATKGMRGGSAKNGDVDAAWSLTTVGDEMLQLDCTANRLPIGEKRLTLKRQVAPTLSHKVDMSYSKVDSALRVLEDMQWPRTGDGSGWDQLWPLVSNNGQGFHAYKEALSRYKGTGRHKGNGVTVLDDDDDD